LWPNYRGKEGKEHTYWSLVETARTPDGPRQKAPRCLGEFDSSAQALWMTQYPAWTVVVTGSACH
jgi:hypothetical protein